MCHVRRLGPADIAEYQQLRLRGLKEAPEAFSSSFEEEQPYPPERWQQRLRPQADRLTLGAFDETTLVGTAGFYREQHIKLQHKGYVVGVYVAPAVRGEGIGHSLLTRLIDEARQISGVEQLLLSVTQRSVAAQALYQHHGFVAFGREPRALRLADGYVDEIHMLLRL